MFINANQTKLFYTESETPVADRSLLSFIRRKLSVTAIFPSFHTDTPFPQDLQSPLPLGFQALQYLVQDWSDQGGQGPDALLEALKSRLVLENGLEVADGLDLHVSLLHAQFLIGHWAVWAFISVEVPKVVDIFLQGAQHHHLAVHSWILDLVKHLHKHYHMAHHLVTVSFAQVYPAQPGSCSSLFGDVTLGQSRPTLLVEDPDELRADLIANGQRVLAHWLHLQQSNTSFNRWNVQGRIVDAILALQNHGALLLPSVFEIFNYSRSYSLSTADAHSVKKVFDNFFNQHPEEMANLNAVFGKHFSNHLAPVSCQLWSSESLMDAVDHEEGPEEDAPGPSIQQNISGKIQNAVGLVVTVLKDLKPIWDASGYRYESPISSGDWTKVRISLPFLLCILVT